MRAEFHAVRGSAATDLRFNQPMAECGDTLSKRVHEWNLHGDMHAGFHAV
jgi:hypothetical protein